MNAHAKFRLFFVPALLALLAVNAPALADNQKAKSNLVRFDPADPEAVSPDTDAKGTLQIETKTSSGRDRLTVCVKKVSSTQTYDFYMEDPEDLGGPLVLVGPLIKSGASQKLKLDTDKGDSLPFDATDVSSLSGLQVEVRVGPTVVYLSGVVPTFGGEKKTLKAKQKLGLALNAPDSNAEGELEISSKASNDDQRIRVKVNAIDFDSHDFFLFIETAVDSNVFENAGEFARELKNKGRYERRTSEGAPLPFGELSAASFSGRKLEVRDQNDVAYLSALIPQLN